MTLSSPVGVNLAQQVDLFGAKITPAPPVLNPGKENQSFCTIQNATVANLEATADVGSVKWYDQATGGTAYASTDVLADGATYYGATLDGTCESLSRVEVNVTISDSAVPTTTEATQSFCTIESPTIASLIASVTTGSITWYDQAAGGTAYASTDALVDGNKYYAANTVGNCESSSRLEVTVTVSDATVPTTTEVTQSFCAVDNPTIADLNASATGSVTWYDQATGGTAYANTDTLVDGNKYYAVNVDGGCESSTRLEVTVTVSDATVPTTSKTTQSFCTVDAPTIADLDASASGSIIWYDQATGGTAYVDTDALADGNEYYAANVDGGCESSSRLKVTVEVGDSTVPTTVEAIQTFCTVINPTIADLSVDVSAGLVTWYDQAAGGTAFASTDVLVDGAKYYAANLIGTCESSTRLEVTVNISDASTPTTTNANQSFCMVNNPIIADLEASASGTITWYDQATGGTAYANTDALVDGNKYYASNSNGSCESSTRLEVGVTVEDPLVPTTTSAMQTFCSIDIPTIADLNASATGSVTWYDQASGGTTYASTDALVDGNKYYAANVDGGCESSTRLEVSVTVEDPSVPTTTNATQIFCSIDNPTIADLNANASGTIIWYDQVSGGTAYANTDVLVDGNKYYASNLDRGCESDTRLEVTVSMDSPSVPTTTSITQTFCSIDSPTIADLEVSASGVITWYDQATGGAAYTNTDALVDGNKYYASNSSGSCESDTRLEISVTINNPLAPTTTNTNQVFCTLVNPTVADLNASASGTIVWYDQATGGTAYVDTDALINGNSYYAVNLEAGCESTTRLKVDVTLGEELTFVSGETTNACLGATETYELPSGLAPYTWIVNGGLVISGGEENDNTIQIQWTSLANTSIGVETTGGCYLNNNKTFDIGVTDVCTNPKSGDDIQISLEVDDINPSIEDEITFSIVVFNTSNAAMFMDVVVTEILTSGFTYVSSSATTGVYDSSSGNWDIPSLLAREGAELTLKVKVNSSGDYLNTASLISSMPEDSDTSNNTVQLLVEPSCLKVYNHMTPNGDGMNDYLTISCIENYSNSTIEVYNRYGSLVYKMKNYKNDWDGVANQTSGMVKKGDALPNGTYFYVLTFEDSSKDKKGWIQITK